MRGLGGFRHRGRGSGRLWRRLLIFVLVMAVGLLALSLYCRPVVMAYAENAAMWQAEQAANGAVSRVVERYATLCNNMIKTTYNDQQRLSSVIADAAAVNTIRTAIGQDIMAQMEGMTAMEVVIPVGSFLGPEILSGWGPALRLPMAVTAMVLTTVSSTLEAVGMNQSAYRVLVNVHVGIGIVTPGGRSHMTLDTAFPVAEAVLLGEVPDTLTEVYGDDQTLLGKIFDYGTVE